MLWGGNCYEWQDKVQTLYHIIKAWDRQFSDFTDAITAAMSKQIGQFSFSMYTFYTLCIYSATQWSFKKAACRYRGGTSRLQTGSHREDPGSCLQGLWATDIPCRGSYPVSKGSGCRTCTSEGMLSHAFIDYNWMMLRG